MTSVMMKISDFGLAMIEAFEGFFAKPYYCPAGVLTQGYGHTAAAGGERLGGIWTKEKARAVLRQDMNVIYGPAVLKLLKRQPTQGEFDAMASFCFNCGAANFAKSSILKFFNRGERQQAAAAFLLWTKAKNPKTGQMQTLAGLVRRRGSEALAFAGVQDINFNGRHDKDDPIYGAMPQAVDQAREKPAKSGTMQGAGAATIGGAAVAIKSVQDALTQAEPHISAGTWIGIALGVTVLAGAAYAAYCRWVDAGRPNPFRKVTT